MLYNEVIRPDVHVRRLKDSMLLYNAFEIKEDTQWVVHVSLFKKSSTVTLEHYCACELFSLIFQYFHQPTHFLASGVKTEWALSCAFSPHVFLLNAHICHAQMIADVNINNFAQNKPLSFLKYNCSFWF